MRGNLYLGLAWQFVVAGVLGLGVVLVLSYVWGLFMCAGPTVFHGLNKMRAIGVSLQLKAHKLKEEWKTFSSLLTHGNTVAWPLH